MSHFRHCPKHRKPLPCAHCALAAKSAQVEPAPVVTVVPPHDADAKPVHPSAIPPDIRKKITESLASAPNVVSDQRKTLLVADTSEGTKTVKATEDIDSTVDDTAEKIVRGRTKKSADALITQKSNKQPAYLKSVTHAVVHNPASKEAPFGYDDNDRPIGVPVGKPYVKPVQTGTVEHVERGPLCKCNRPLCRYCHPENIARTGVLASLMHDYDQIEVRSLNEAELRRQFGLPEFNPTVKTDTSKFVHYPTLLSLKRESWLNFWMSRYLSMFLPKPTPHKSTKY